MISRRSALLALTGLAVLPTASCLAPKNSVTLQGCGATFPAPLYKRWFLEYYKKHPDVRTSYLAIGSGAGIRQFTERMVDFGATDEALSEKDLAALAKTLDAELIQVPMTAGAIALCYNLPGRPELKLSRQAYSGMIIGDIKYWDDDEIKKTNPEVNLPHRQIVFVRRAESSGTTFNFANHLQAIDKERWKERGLKAGKSPDWPVGIGGKGNAGVSALIQQTPGAIGYIEEGYAALAKLSTAALQNHAGQFVLPGEETARIALEEAHFNKVYGATVPDPRGSQAYPIVTFTWVVCRKRYSKPRVAEKLRDLLLFCLGEAEGEGQSFSASLYYVPLPARTAEQMRKVVEQIEVKPEVAAMTGGAPLGKDW
jgi:phosphate transport system substrate-binding protein